MNTQDIMIVEPLIKVKEGNISFDFTELKEQALQVAEMVSKTIVTDDNVKQSKKMLSVVNKVVKSLEDERILVKKQMLAPYLLLEKEVKEIVSIISDANELVKVQVQELDHIGRLEKEEEIKAIWDKRVQHYDIKDIFTIDDFLTPQHLNKSISINKIEQEMTEFLSRTQNDVQAILSMLDSESILLVYKDNKSLGESITIVTQRKEQENKVKQFIDDNKVAAETFNIEITGLENRSIIEKFLKDNNIGYKLL